MKLRITLILLIVCAVTLNAESVIPLRTQLSLNGIWNFTPEGRSVTSIKVPDYWDARPGFTDVKHAVYERSITIPATKEWMNKKIRVEFDAVNFIAAVYINNKKVGEHIGGYIPFSFDISPYVTPGKPFTLKVDVKGGCYEPIVDKNGYPQWPVGFVGQEHRWGIVFDVWLRAYGQAAINDAFIQTSYRNRKINVDYTVRNDYSSAKTFYLKGTIASSILPDRPVKEIRSGNFTLQPGESKVITVDAGWQDPRFWSPSDPFLYYLHSSLYEKDSDTPVDKETRRFGFREIWIANGRLMFNGHPITLMGTNLVQHSEFYNSQRYYFMTPETWNSTIDRLFQLNLRTVRFHMQPVPQFILDIADERGLLVIDESAIYARKYILKSNKQVYLENCKKWIGPWVTAQRNHPSVIVWNAENEMGVGWLHWMTNAELKSLGDAIRKYDTTRPVNYDGDRDVGDAMVDYHYPEKYNKTVSGSIYSWKDLVRTDKPTGVGEFLTHYGKDGNVNQWWQGTWVRGMRYVGFSDIRPYRHDWALLCSDITPKIQNLINGFSPVAVFDTAYDNLGIDPLINENYPLLFAGDTAHRTLVLYNDEFADTVISIEVLIKSSAVYQAVYWYNGDRTPVQTVIAEGSGTYTVPLGEHIQIPVTFYVPALAEGFVDHINMQLIARKKDEVKFRETKRFSLRNRRGEPPFTGPTPDRVILGQPE